MKTKKCHQCKKELSIIEFKKTKRYKDNLNCWCRKCTNEYMRNHRRKPKTKEYLRNYQIKYRKTPKYKKYIHDYSQTPEGIYRILKGSAIKRNLSVDFKIEVFIKWYNNQEQKCYYCNRTLNEIKRDIKERNVNKNRLSIDRKDNTKGYNLDNIVLACMRCNTIKSSYFTEKEMLKIGKLIYCAIDDKQAEENYHKQIG